MLATAGYGWHYETSLHALRLALSGAFDRRPQLRILLGHLGEGIPSTSPGSTTCSTPSPTTCPSPSAATSTKPLIDQMLRADLDAPRKQRHTVKRIFERLLD
ncbi:hypothetical protein AMK16_26830 [Streptomyces sp. CB00455]|uniref:hypothetical protein n=1 Tax=Streptomyces sp. CB00455 TaxID=1703927 RepID=UPI000969330D|nr:hypothetical protein AMK16_26830 [Streptomyces sp. CB00455]